MKGQLEASKNEHWVIRRGALAPPSDAGSMTFSHSLRIEGSRAAAVYRVTGLSSKPDQVDSLSRWLCGWLNDPDRDSMQPVGTYVGRARIRLTKAGHAAGFLPAVRHQ